MQFQHQANLDELFQLIQGLKKQLGHLEEQLNKPPSCPEIRRIWIPRFEVMNFLGYADTQIAAVTKKYKISTTQIGKHIFYSNSSLLEILDKNKK